MEILNKRPVRIIIPSHKRADKVLTANVVADAAICIPESQLEEYKKHNPRVELITHPDSVIGLPPKREWMRKEFGDIFMLDDDITELRRLYTTSNYKVNNKEVVRDIVYSTAEAAREAGVYLFGFCKDPNPLAYRPQKPISLTGFINACACGLLSGSKLYYDPVIKCAEDYWISCLNAYHHRYLWRDNRFVFLQKTTFVGSGGQAEFRNMKTEEEDLKYLVKMFGSQVIQLKGDSHLRKRVHEFEKTIKLPF
jgi:hypothetical protein